MHVEYRNADVYAHQLKWVCSIFVQLLTSPLSSAEK